MVFLNKSIKFTRNIDLIWPELTEPNLNKEKTGREVAHLIIILG